MDAGAAQIVYCENEILVPRQDQGLFASPQIEIRRFPIAPLKGCLVQSMLDVDEPVPRLFLIEHIPLEKMF